MVATSESRLFGPTNQAVGMMVSFLSDLLSLNQPLETSF